MPEIELPEGQYFSLCGAIHETNGGKTRALLMRNRMFGLRAGIEPTLLTVDSAPHYPATRAVLREQGQLVEPMRLLNIFEWYREHDVDDLLPLDDVLPDIEGYDARQVAHPDGTIHRTVYRTSRSGPQVMRDFRRPDGSVYARASVGQVERKYELTSVTLINSGGRPVAHWPDLAGWYQHWIRELTPPGVRAFVISDNKAQLPDVVGLCSDQFHIIHVIHNMHLMGRHRWNSQLVPAHVPPLRAISQIDGFVALTDQQREDIAARFGATNNLFVVPNPVEPPLPPDPLPARERRRFAIVARLEQQKQLHHAVRAFALVLKEEPSATLDIYGSGSCRGQVEGEIAKLGLGKSVLLHGFDPQARDTLWTATGFLMTSQFEGYPLATLESMSHGCPVISYDIKYGPSQQISHGVDGYLVEAGDTKGMADRIVELIRNPELVARMSDAAFDKAKQHDYTAFLNDWRYVLNSVVAAKQHRTTLDSVTLTVTNLGYVRTPWLARLRHRMVEFAAQLEVSGQSPRATLDSAVVTLDAVDAGTGSIVALPMEVRRSGTTFALTAVARLPRTYLSIGKAARSLRLRFVWENSSWDTTLSGHAIQLEPATWKQRVRSGLLRLTGNKIGRPASTPKASKRRPGMVTRSHFRS